MVPAQLRDVGDPVVRGCREISALKKTKKETHKAVEVEDIYRRKYVLPIMGPLNFLIPCLGRHGFCTNRQLGHLGVPWHCQGSTGTDWLPRYFGQSRGRIVVHEPAKVLSCLVIPTRQLCILW